MRWLDRTSVCDQPSPVNSDISTGSNADTDPTPQSVSAGTTPFRAAFGRTFAWAGGHQTAPTFGPSGMAGAITAGAVEGFFYAWLHFWFVHQEIHPQIGAISAVICIALITGFSKEAGLGRLVDRATDGSAAGEQGGMAAGAVLLSWIVKTQGLAQIYAVGEDISHPTGSMLVMLPLTARLSEVAFLQLRSKRASRDAATVMLALIWLAAALLLLPPGFVTALSLCAVVVLVLGGSIRGEISSRDLSGLGETGFLVSLAACAVLTYLY